MTEYRITTNGRSFRVQSLWEWHFLWWRWRHWSDEWIPAGDFPIPAQFGSRDRAQEWIDEQLEEERIAAAGFHPVA